MDRVYEERLQKCVAAVLEDLGSAVRSLLLYGSAATGSFHPGRSDLNLLVVVDRVELPTLDVLQARMGGWLREKIAAPLVVDESFLARSLDSYPLEILGMQAGYRILAGIDPLADLVPAAADVRLQVEREIKSRSLALQVSYLESCGKADRMAAILAAAVPSLEAILRGILFLRGEEWCRAGSAQDEAWAVEGGGEVIRDLRALRAGKGPADRRRIRDLYAATMDLLDRLGHRWEIGQGDPREPGAGG